MTNGLPSNVRRRIIIVSMLMAFILYLDRICLAEIVKSASFNREMELSKDEIGRVLAAFFFTYALFQVPAGWASDRFGARTMLTSYIVLWSLFTALTGVMSSYGGLLLMRLLCGAAEAGAYPTCGAVIRRWIPFHARARASALVALGGRIGGTLAPFLTAWMVVAIGHWRPVLWIDGAVGFVIAGIYWWVVRNRPAEHPRCNPAEQRLIGHPHQEKPLTNDQFVALLLAFCRSRSLWLNAIGLFLINVGWAFLITWLPTYLKEQRGVEPVEGGRMVSLVLAFGMVGQVAGGWGADWSVRRLGRRWGRVFPLVASGFVAGTAYLCCLFVGTTWGIVACCCVVSFAVDMGNPALWAFLQDVGGRATGAAVGWSNMWGNFGASLTAIMVPELLKVGGDMATGQQYVFLACAIAPFLSGIVAFGLDATRPLLDDPVAELEPG